MDTAHDVKQALLALASPYTRINLEWYFKTGEGEYGHGDLFHGLKVPQTRSVAKQFQNIDESELLKLLKSQYHEERQCALFIIVLRFNKAKDRETRKHLFNLYLDQAGHNRVNNWDLVDATAPFLGAYLVETKCTRVLEELAETDNLWLNRISVMLTFAFIKVGIVEPTLEMAEYHLHHKHDLMHKAVGWMLREMGKVNHQALLGFLKLHAHEMPRTMLRYSIEKLTETERKRWLAIKPAK